MKKRVDSTMNNKVIRFIIRFFSTGFFIGNIPGAPGTYGSILALILLYYFSIFNNIYIILSLIIFGVLISYLEEKYSGVEDDPSVVIDEIVGMFITFIAINMTPLNIILGFSFFRLFDIWKPYIIDDAQDFSGGIGVMADDILAGFFANFIMKMLFFLI